MATEYERRVKVLLLQLLYALNVLWGQDVFSVAKSADGMTLELVYGDRSVLMEQGDTLAYALNTVAVQFGFGWRYGMEHVLHVGVE